MKRDLAEELVGIYNDIDAFLRRTLKYSASTPHKFLLEQAAKTNAVVARGAEELKVFADLRNLIVHNPYRSRLHPAMSPHPKLIERYNAIKQAILHPPTALSIAIPAAAIYTTELKAKLFKVVKTMNDNVYTHVPVIEGGKMIGIFSENAILSFLAARQEALLTNDTKIGELKEFIPLEAHQGEIFAFLPRRATLSDVYTVFNNAIKQRKRIGMVFITEHGRSTEKLLGIITAWDLASPDFHVTELSER